MSLVNLPGRRPAPMTPERTAVIDAQVDILTTLMNHSDLGLAGDVQVLAVALEYLAKAHGLTTGQLAMAAMSSDGGRH